MSDYIPPTRDVRNYFAYGCGPEHTWNESRQDFDRWLAEVERSAAEKAWDEGYWQGINSHTGPGNPYRREETE